MVIRFKKKLEYTTYLHPCEDLLTPQMILRKLAGAGYRLPKSKADRKLIAEYLSSVDTEREFTVVGRTGFIDNNSYILPHGEFVPKDSGKRIIFEPQRRRMAVTDVLGGSLEGWRKGVAKRAVHSTRLMFAIATSLACPLLHIAGVESGLFHFYGDTTTGKTLALIVAYGIFQNPDRIGLPHWEITPTGFEESAADHCDRVLVLDETGHVGNDADALKAIRKFGFKLTAGTERTRSKHFTKLRRTLSWRLLVLSSGEVPIWSYATQGKSVPGNWLRLLDIPARVGVHGVFETLPKGVKDSIAFAKAIEAQAAANYGHAGNAFVERLVKDRADHKALQARVTRYKDSFLMKVGVPRTGVEHRFAERFAIAYAAARLAIRYGILPWTEKQASHAIRSVYLAAREVAPDWGNVSSAALAAMRKHLQSSKVYRVDHLQRHDRWKSRAKTAKALIITDPKHGEVFMVRREQLNDWIGNKITVRAFTRFLQDQNALIVTDSHTATKEVQLPWSKQKRERFLWIKGSFVRTGSGVGEGK